MSKTKMRFESIEQRDKQLKALKTKKYSVDKKDPLVVWLEI